MLFLYSFSAKAQTLTSKQIWDTLDVIDYNAGITGTQKLELFYSWEKKMYSLKKPADSVLAKVFNKIGKYESIVSNDYEKAIFYTHKAFAINNSRTKGASKLYAIYGALNLGYYYDAINDFNNAIIYNDSCVFLAEKFHDCEYEIMDARLVNSYIYFRIGNYEKCISESTIGLHTAKIISDSIYIMKLLNQRSQALMSYEKLSESQLDIMQVLMIAEKKKYETELKIKKEKIKNTGILKKLLQALSQLSYQVATAYKTRAYIFKYRQNFDSSAAFYLQCIKSRLISKDSGQIAGDYNDIANLYRDSLKQFDKAIKHYNNGLQFAQAIKDSIRLSRINDNLGLTYTNTGNYKEAEKCFIKSMSYLRLPNTHHFSNPSASAFNLVGNKELILDILMNKSALLLAQYKKNNQQPYLSACVQTALLTDSVITDTRHEQFGEQTKLYWRNRTRSFYTDAMEATFLSQNISYAFYFMEKSRAVLLNDRLNELGARAQLPPDALAQNQQLQLEYLKQQRFLNQLNPQSAAYADQVTKVIEAKEKLELFIKSLEKENPLYYQYKYADVVPSVAEMQKYLAAGKQSFVQYFMNDTVAYVLTLTSSSGSFIKLGNKKFNQQTLVNFLQSCTNKKLLQNNYNAFAKESYRLYQTIFQQLQIPQGRTIICPDNVLIPFEALCTDAAGKNFLINQYAFSYVYSARYLLMSFSSVKPKANFAGFAPVHFQPSLGVVDLLQSEASLKKSKSYYRSATLFSAENASKNNFMSNLANYTVVAVLSHAKADNSGAEPVLYMQDSLIHLSELNMLKNVSANLVMLSACQTNVGQNATGEGVYSLARGFAAAGIPALSATLWEADEQTVYALTEKMNEYLSQGNAKDEALAKAKRFFLQDNTNETTLPYYWANMILIGNAEPLQFSAASNNWWWIAGIAIIAAFGAAWFFTKRRTAK